jgi:hypothetical protein
MLSLTPPESAKVKLSSLIFRRDQLHHHDHQQHEDLSPVLQMITGGFRYGMFSHTWEERFRRIIHAELLRRRGLPWPLEHGDSEYWSSDPRQQLRNRQIYHGLRLASLSIVNRLIGQAHEEAADKEALTLARRFLFKNRYSIYRATALSRRALQLTVAFPALSLAIFNDRSGRDESDRCNEAVQLIEAGAPMKTIADLMRVPIAFRKVKPGPADLVSLMRDVPDNQRLMHAYMPASLPRMKLWLSCIREAEMTGPGFVEWVAKHALEIGGTFEEVRNFLVDLRDWVWACDPSNDGLTDGAQFVVRRFSPDMSLKTVTKLSGEWHKAVANDISGPNYEFPEPWCGAGRSGEYEIVPITNSADLYREGYVMHHCVGARGSAVQAGYVYIYSIREGQKRVATLELLRNGDSIEIGELRGSCNSQVSPKIRRAVKSWLRSQSGFRLPKADRISQGPGAPRPEVTFDLQYQRFRTYLGAIPF